MEGGWHVSQDDRRQIMFVLSDGDGMLISMQGDAAFQSNYLKGLARDLNITGRNSLIETPLPFHNDFFAKGVLYDIVQWCTNHRDDVFDPAAPITLTHRDDDWLEVSDERLECYYQGATFLQIPGLLAMIDYHRACVAEKQAVQRNAQQQ